MKMGLFHLANKLYTHCYPIYYPLYSAWKAYSERAERKIFREYVKPGMVVADIGANIGVYTQFFSRLVGSEGLIHAFEPDPSNFEHLKKNAGSLRNSVLNCAALGEHDGTIKLFISDDMNVDHRTFDSGDGRRSIDIPVKSLDNYFSPGQRVDFIKIDVQGYEWNVLQGAKRVIADNDDITILMEFSPYALKQAGAEPMKIFDFFKSRGFRVKLVAETLSVNLDDEIEFNPSDPDYYCNLLIRKKAIH